MSLPDAAEARQISAQLETLMQQHAEGDLPHQDTPLRLYRVGTGGFVRVLDSHPEPISPGMLEAINKFIGKRERNDLLSEEKPAAEHILEVEAAEQRQDEDNCVGDGDQSRERSVDDNSIVRGAGVATDARADVKMAAPWETVSSTRTPKELLIQNLRASEWLTKTSAKEEDNELVAMEKDVEMQCDDDAGVERLPSAIDHPTLFEQWPPQLEERRQIWYLPKPSERKSGRMIPQPVVYWMRNTLRVTHGNFGLEAAILLSRRLSAALVVVCLIPSSIVYPACHATTASDAYARFTYAALYDQFKHAGIPFYGFTAKEDGLAPTDNDKNYGLQPNPLFELLDCFSPHAVVTDAAFDMPSRSDTTRLARYLEMNRASCLWSLLTMDSTTSYPAYQLSTKLQNTLKVGVGFASEGQFGAEYAALAQPRNGTYVFSSLPRSEGGNQHQECTEVLRRLCLEEVNWKVVKAETSQSSPQMRRFGEAEGLQLLSQLLSDSSHLPAIQAELQGGGVLSLLPFIRHGTLFAGYVLRRITAAISSSPVPTSPEERKALAMRKVMRSRVMNHLCKERDYALYLALWASVQSEGNELVEPNQVDATLLSTSETLLGLRSSSPRLSSLDAYRHLVPAWAFSNASLDGHTDGEQPVAALYDPYELESARTKDFYWNDIQKFLIENQYLHPLLVVYWAYRLFTWTVSCRAGMAIIEALLSQCVLGSQLSPDAAITVWKHLFRIGISASVSNRESITALDGLRSFQVQLEGEIKSQPKLQLRS